MQLNVLAVETNTKFSRKNQIKRYEENPYQVLNLERTSIISLYFCFLYLKRTTNTKSYKKKCVWGVELTAEETPDSNAK